MAALIMYCARGLHTERDDVGDFFGCAPAWMSSG
jgi:hypothetical protein